MANSQRELNARRVRTAINGTKRKDFVPEHFVEVADRDEPVMVATGVTMPPRSLVQLMVELLELKPESKVLEIGTGSGYQTAVLARLCNEVHSVDIREIPQRNRAQLPENVSLHLHNGAMGVAEHAPYDAIIMGCGAPGPLVNLCEQLKDGGIMVMPRGFNTYQTITKYKRDGNTMRDLGDFAYARFVMMEIPGVDWSAMDPNSHVIEEEDDGA